MAQNDPELLARLQRNGLEFVIIGGVCCIYYGVTLATFDLDICCRFDEPNLRRIERAVSDLHPYHRLAANKLPLELTTDLCSRLKNLYLQTDLGKLDVLGEVAGVGPSEEVLRRSQKAKLSYGEFRFMTIDALMDAKEAAGRERDLIALNHLRPIKEKLEQKSRNLNSEI
jgi:hypothetical protein